MMSCGKKGVSYLLLSAANDKSLLSFSMNGDAIHIVGAIHMTEACATYVRGTLHSNRQLML